MFDHMVLRHQGLSRLETYPSIYHETPGDKREKSNKKEFG